MGQTTNIQGLEKILYYTIMNFQNKILLERNKQQAIEIQKKKKKSQNIKNIKNNQIIQTFKQLMKPFPLQQEYNSVIPLHCYTCWHTKNLPPLMKQNYDFLVACNPEIQVHLYDEEDCRQFIHDHFEPDVVEAYNSLVPCSYKSDLWRFCVLYIYGGIYIDIKYQCANGFKLIALTEKEHFVRDRPIDCIYTALIVTYPKNEIMLQCIQKIVQHTKTNFYGKNPLSPTGPGLLGEYVNNQEREQLPMYFETSVIENKINESYIVFHDRVILKYYYGYREEQRKNQKKKHYDLLWKERKIYYNN